MDLKEAIEKRRSVRAYSDRAVGAGEIEEIISAGLRAPSACDRRAWRFIVVDREELKQRIFDEGGTRFIKDSPVGIIVLYDNRTDDLEYCDHIQSGAAAIQNMLLAATALGIGSCWVCHLPYKKTMRALFAIPRWYEPIAYVALGYPAAPAGPRTPRERGPRDVTAWNRFDFEEGAPPSAVRLKARRAAKDIYFRLPLSLKKLLRSFAERFVVKFKE
jgi:nitroreductase